jgi:hypothetical protein
VHQNLGEEEEQGDQLLGPREGTEEGATTAAAVGAIPAVAADCGSNICIRDLGKKILVAAYQSSSISQ